MAKKSKKIVQDNKILDNRYTIYNTGDIEPFRKTIKNISIRESK